MGGEYAFGKMAGHMKMVALVAADCHWLVIGFDAKLGCSRLPLVGFGNCDSLYSHLSSWEVVAEEYLARQFLEIQDML